MRPSRRKNTLAAQIEALAMSYRPGGGGRKSEAEKNADFFGKRRAHFEYESPQTPRFGVPKQRQGKGHKMKPHSRGAGARDDYRRLRGNRNS